MISFLEAVERARGGAFVRPVSWIGTGNAIEWNESSQLWTVVHGHGRFLMPRPELLLGEWQTVDGDVLAAEQRGSR